jgi:putative endonuclease
VYILKSEKYPITYVGSTQDIHRRIIEHNSGKQRFTSRYVPWVIVYTEEFAELSSARKREKYFKSAAGRRFIKKNNIIPV